MHLKPQGRHRFAEGGHAPKPYLPTEHGCDYLIPLHPIVATWESCRTRYTKPSPWAWLKRWIRR